jgi:ornithine cyclodeaminase/alanine dehydrogenase-like protein (mu-crystallin family)
MTNNIPFISDEQIKKLLPMNEAIELMKNAFVQITNKSVTIPQRLNIDMPEVNADSLIMPVYSAAEKKYGVKIVSMNRDNPSKNLPFIHAVMILLDAENGKPLALLDAENLTAIRTGAASGLATKILSNNNSSVGAIFGAGIQARYQLRALCEVRNIKNVLLFDNDQSRALSFKDEMEHKLGLNIEICSDQNLLKDTQIICTATTSSVPVFDDKYITEGTHINAIGSYLPNKREISSETIARSKIFVDSREACLKEAGDLIIPKNEGIEFEVIEMGEVLQNKTSGRSSKEEITFFKSVGNAAQDLISAIHIFNKIK